MTKVYIFYSETFHTVLVSHAQDKGYHLSKESSISMRLMIESKFLISVLVKIHEIDNLTLENPHR